MATINVAKRKVVVFSGGSAANSLVDVFNEVIEKNNCALTYVIPISDNGGSSSEILRVFGGPGIGDVRSRFGGFFCVLLFCCLLWFLSPLLFKMILLEFSFHLSYPCKVIIPKNCD